jgi:dUTP pyrophosphatase
MEIFKVSENAELPVFATKGSACFDLRACLNLDEKVITYNPHNKETYLPVKQSNNNKLYINIPPSFRALVPTGLIFNIPEGHVIKIYIRSSFALKYGLMLANGTAIIDSDYCDPTYIMLYNSSDTSIVLYHGDRIAQAELVKLKNYDLVETKIRPVKNTDRTGGMGSTGTN